MLHAFPFPNEARSFNKAIFDASALGQLTVKAIGQRIETLDRLRFQSAKCQFLNSVGQPVLQEPPIIGRRLGLEEIAPFRLRNFFLVQGVGGSR